MYVTRSESDDTEPRLTMATRPGKMVFDDVMEVKTNTSFIDPWGTWIFPWHWVSNLLNEHGDVILK
eukprot:5720705-Karenia_brevis.AAC.1